MNENPKYGKIMAERKEFHADEPLFLLRATDSIAPVAVEAYAGLVRAMALAKTDANAAATLQAVADQCENVAAAMRVWQETNKHLVKLPD